MTHHQKNLSGKLKEYGGEQKRKKEKKKEKPHFRGTFQILGKVS